MLPVPSRSVGLLTRRNGPCIIPSTRASAPRLVSRTRSTVVGEQSVSVKTELRTPNPEIKCAFFRVIEPRTTSFRQFMADIDREGLDPLLTVLFAFPMVILQRGPAKAIEGAAIDTLHLDGVTDGILSHRDLMWPHRAEVADLLKGKANSEGQILITDLYEAKLYAAKKIGRDAPTFASHAEVPLIFLRCGGDPETGKVDLDDVLAFLSGYRPKKFGRIDLSTLPKALKYKASYPEPGPFESATSKFEFVQWALLMVVTALFMLITVPLWLPGRLLKQKAAASQA